MRNIFHYDGPLFEILSKLGDFALLNVLVLVGSLPLITMGAAVTAGHLTALKLVRNEGKLFSDFWKSYVCNLKQGSLLWLGFVTVWALCAFGMHYFSWVQPAVSVLLGVVGLLSVLISLWVFPVLSRYVDSVGNILRNGTILCFRHLFRTAVMLLSILLLPAAMLFLGLAVLPILLLYGISVPMWVSAKLYDPVFAELDRQVLENQS